MSKIPILGQVTDQKLIISFKKRDTGEGDITFRFDPPFVEAISPEQQAAVNVAEQVIRLFGLDQPQPTTEGINNVQ
jgi:hypothetical protein